MRITIVNNHIDLVLGGSEIQCNFIANGLKEKGHDVIYVIPSKDIDSKVEASYKTFVVQKDAKSIIEAIESTKPDVVYWRYNKNFFYQTAKYLAKRRVRLVFAVAHLNDLKKWSAKSSHGNFRGTISRVIRMLKSRYNHLGLKFVSALTVNNRDFVELSPIVNTHYVPNGMTEDLVPFSWPRPYVVWVANFKPDKRPELFVEVAKYLQEYGIDALMVGRLTNSKYNWIYDSANLPNNLYYLNTMNPLEVNGLLASSRLHIHTCKPEGFPNIFIQAWMQSTPSISFEFDPSGYISEQSIGMVSNGSIELFKSQIIEWATDEDRCAKIGIKAEKFAKKMFSVNKMVENVETVLKSSIIEK